MFYNRQRELALRKCMGSDTKGLFHCFCRDILDDVCCFLSIVGCDGSIPFSHVCLYAERGYDSFFSNSCIQLTIHSIYCSVAGMFMHNHIPHLSITPIKYYQSYYTKAETAYVSQHDDRPSVGHFHFLCRRCIWNNHFFRRNIWEDV